MCYILEQKLNAYIPMCFSVGFHDGQTMFYICWCNIYRSLNISCSPATDDVGKCNLTNEETGNQLKIEQRLTDDRNRNMTWHKIKEIVRENSSPMPNSARRNHVQECSNTKRRRIERRTAGSKNSGIHYK